MYFFLIYYLGPSLHPAIDAKVPFAQHISHSLCCSTAVNFACCGTRISPAVKISLACAPCAANMRMRMQDANAGCSFNASRPTLRMRDVHCCHRFAAVIWGWGVFDGSLLPGICQNYYY